MNWNCEPLNSCLVDFVRVRVVAVAFQDAAGPDLAFLKSEISARRAARQVNPVHLIGESFEK